MAKFKRVVIGDILNPKEETGGSKYVKIQEKKDKQGNVLPSLITLRPGDLISVETTRQQKESAEAAMKSGKLTEDMGTDILAKLDKRPDFVFGQLILVRREEE